MTGDKAIKLLKKHNCKVEFRNDGDVKITLMQNEREWSITRKDLKDALESTMKSGCIV